VKCSTMSICLINKDMSHIKYNGNEVYQVKCNGKLVHSKNLRITGSSRTYSDLNYDSVPWTDGCLFDTTNSSSNKNDIETFDFEGNQQYIGNSDAEKPGYIHYVAKGTSDSHIYTFRDWLVVRYKAGMDEYNGDYTYPSGFYSEYIRFAAEKYGILIAISVGDRKKPGNAMTSSCFDVYLQQTRAGGSQTLLSFWPADDRIDRYMSKAIMTYDDYLIITTFTKYTNSVNHIILDFDGSLNVTKSDEFTTDTSGFTMSYNGKWYNSLPYEIDGEKGFITGHLFMSEGSREQNGIYLLKYNWNRFSKNKVPTPLVLRFPFSVSENDIHMHTCGPYLLIYLTERSYVSEQIASHGIMTFTINMTTMSLVSNHVYPFYNAYDLKLIWVMDSKAYLILKSSGKSTYILQHTLPGSYSDAQTLLSNASFEFNTDIVTTGIRNNRPCIFFFSVYAQGTYVDKSNNKSKNKTFYRITSLSRKDVTSWPATMDKAAFFNKMNI